VAADARLRNGWRTSPTILPFPNLKKPAATGPRFSAEVFSTPVGDDDVGLDVSGRWRVPITDEVP
jgi:hypothetical protein